MLDYQQNDPGRLVLAKNEGYKQSHILQNKTQATAPAITDTREAAGSESIYVWACVC